MGGPWLPVNEDRVTEWPHSHQGRRALSPPPSIPVRESRVRPLPPPERAVDPRWTDCGGLATVRDALTIARARQQGHRNCARSGPRCRSATQQAMRCRELSTPRRHIAAPPAPQCKLRQPLADLPTRYDGSEDEWKWDDATSRSSYSRPSLTDRLGVPTRLDD